MEKPRGQTRATSWHPPWLQERSQPYSPHVPAGSERQAGAPRGTGATPGTLPRSPLQPCGTTALAPAPGGDRDPTWAGDALLSIRARAEVGGDAEATAAAEGAESCRARGRGSSQGRRDPPAPSWGAWQGLGCLYSRRVHCPLPGASIQPGQHPLPKPEKQTWGPTRRLGEGQRQRGQAHEDGEGDARGSGHPRAHRRPIPCSVKAGSGRTRAWSEPPTRWDSRRGLAPQLVQAPQRMVTGETSPRSTGTQGASPMRGSRSPHPRADGATSGCQPRDGTGSPESSRGLGVPPLPGAAARGRRKKKKKRGARLPLHGKAGWFLPPGVHPALAAREEQGHTGSLDEQLEQHDRRLQHARSAAFLPAFLPACLPRRHGAARRGTARAPTACWPLALLLLPPAGPGTMRGVEGGESGERRGGPGSPPTPRVGMLTQRLPASPSPRARPRLGDTRASTPGWGPRGRLHGEGAGGEASERRASPLLSFPTSGKAPAWPLPTPPPPPGGTGLPSQPCAGTHQRGARSR